MPGQSIRLGEAMSSERSRETDNDAPVRKDGDGGGGAAARGEQLLGHAAPSVITQVEGLVDMLAWIRIELSASHPGTLSQGAHDRISRALVQLEMALAMAKELVDELSLLRGRT